MTEPVHPSRAAALCLIAVPALWVVGELVSPGQAGTAARELDVAGAHPDRWAASMGLVALGSMLLIAALPALLRLARPGSARIALASVVLLGYSNIVAAADAINEMGVRAMVSSAADRAQMIAYMDRVEAGPSAVFFATGGISFLVGAVLLAVALGRSRAVPAWNAVLIAASFVANLFGWGSASSPLVLGSAVVMLVALAPVAAALGGGGSSRRTSPVVATA